MMWSPGGQPLRRIEVDISPGEIGTIHPSIPHHGWAVDETPTDAWLVLYHNPDSSAAFDIAANIHNSKIQTDRRRVTAEELDSAGEYALIAWDIADRVRTQRHRVNLTIHQMAELINIDASHLSRLENISTNLSLDILIKICEFLRIDLRDLLISKRWCFEKRSLDALINVRCAWAESDHKHKVHPQYHSFTKDSVTNVENGFSFEPDFSSWIVLNGQAIVEFVSDGKDRVELLYEGDIIHFRKNNRLCLRALSDCQIITFHLFPLCSGNDTKRLSPSEEESPNV
jgi:transcriptional regulator with XRE-family HTH domain